MTTKLRTLRHWKQRFDSEHADFIFRRRLLFNGQVYEPGDVTPKELVENKGKLRRFWESGHIELADFDSEPKDESVDGFKVVQRGIWYIIETPQGQRKARGAKQFAKLIASLKKELETAPEPVAPEPAQPAETVGE